MIKRSDDMGCYYVGEPLHEDGTTTFEPQNEDCRGYADTFKCTYCGCLVYSAYYMRTGQFDYHFCPYCGRPVAESGGDTE